MNAEDHGYGLNDVEFGFIILLLLAGGVVFLISSLAPSGSFFAFDYDQSQAWLEILQRLGVGALGLFCLAMGAVALWVLIHSRKSRKIEG